MNEGQETNVTPPAQEVVTQQPAATPPWERNDVDTPANQQGTQQATPNDQEEQRKARGGFQRRIDELVREREHERGEKQRLFDLLAKQSSGQQPQPQSTQTNAAPTLEQFDSYEKYLAAATKWEARNVYEEMTKADREKAQKTEAETRQRQAQETHYKAMVEQQKQLHTISTEAEKKYPDFHDVAFADVPIAPVVGMAILESEVAADLMYHLGKNKAEAQRLSKLSPTSALRELGKIEASLQRQQQSSAPAPINPISGKQASNDAPSANDDMKTWIAKRNRQLGRK